MAISRTGGVSANNSAAVTSLALPSYTTTTGRIVVVAIALGATTSSVSSISSSAGVYSGWTLRASINGGASDIRTEIWTATVTTGAATVFTVNITGACTVAAALEEYSGVSSFGNTGSNSATSDSNPRQSIITQDGNNFIAVAMGFACQSGDTINADLGTSVRSSVPAATAVGIYFFDNTAVADETLRALGFLSTARDWATAGVELRSGGAAITVVDYAAISAPAATGQPTWQTGHPNFSYLHFLDPLFAQGSSSAGTSNYGFVA